MSKATLLLSLCGGLLLSCSTPRTSQEALDPPPPAPDMRMPNVIPPPCEGLACFQAKCTGTDETIVTGVVTAPNGKDPIREAIVYVPTGGAPEEFPPLVACDVCSSPVGGKPVTMTQTDVDGTFELRRVPVTMNTPIVIQKGRWRKVVNLNVAKCERQGITAEQGRLPKDRTEGVIPQMAVAVGKWDAIECVLKHVGLSEREYGAPGTSKAVHLYDNDDGGSGTPGGVSVDDLLRNFNRMLQYQIIFLNCSDQTYSRALLKDAQVIKNLTDYVTRGGRLYVTDWSYDFIQQVPAFAPFICYNDDKPCTVTTPHGFAEATVGLRTGNQTQFYADVDQTTREGKALAQWLTKLSRPVSGGKVRIDDRVGSYVLVRQMAQDLAKHPSTVWLSAELSGQRRPVSMTFDYPPGPNACGRVLYSSYHTREHDDHTVQFPRYCPTTDMLPQEQVLEFLLFELGACVQPPG